MIKAITSKDNPRVKFALSLKENKFRKANKMFLAETFKSLEMALANNQVVEVFATEWINLPEDITLNLVSEDILKKLSSNVNPEGVVFIAKMNEYHGDYHKILYLDHIQDPGNMGTLIRTALAFSYDAVVASKESVSFYNEKVINSSKGAIFAIPVLEEDLSKYKGSHQIIVTSLSDKSISLDDVKVKGDFVLVLGSESHGVSKSSMDLADIQVKIPMDNIDSLNVAVAGGILMYKIH